MTSHNNLTFRSITSIKQSESNSRLASSNTSGRSSTRWAILAPMVLLLAGFSNPAATESESEYAPEQRVIATSSPSPSPAQRPLDMPGPSSVADLAEMVSGAVVNISTKSIPEAQNQEDSIAPRIPDQFREMFPDLFGRRNGPTPSPQVRPQRSLGSGFVIDSSGIIITNNHVVANADRITVGLPDGTELDAELVGRDTKTDLAVLRVEPESPLPSLELGLSSNLRVGDWVMAIGNPFGLGGSVTLGIVSAQNRNINSGPYDSYIQTDAAINRGNSGGPLINMSGQVVGINTAIFSTSGGSIGIGFAVPVDTAKSVINQLVQFGETRRGWLGVHIQEVSDDIAQSMGLERSKGALVTKVEDDGPANSAGFEVGDLILKFDGQDVPKMRDLPRIVAATEIGARVSVEILRFDQNTGEPKKMTLQVLIQRLKEDKVAGAGNTPAKPKRDTSTVELLGLTISDADEQIRRKFQLGSDIEGPIVVSVDPATDAGDKGIGIGSRILSVAQRPVASAADVEREIRRAREAGAKAFLMLLEVPNGSKRFIALQDQDE